MKNNRQSGAGLWAGVFFWFIIVLILIFGLKQVLKKDNHENNKTSDRATGSVRGNWAAGIDIHSASKQSPVQAGIYTAGVFLQY